MLKTPLPQTPSPNGPAAKGPDLKAPEFGERLEATAQSDAMLRFLLRRRSVTAKSMTTPGPNDAELSLILRAGARVPDHGKLAPWRFIVFTGADRDAFGTVLVDAFRATSPDAPDELLAFERTRFLRAPTVVAVISRVRENHKIPEWEQVLSAGAVCQTMLITGQALGYAGQWLTEWYAYDRTVKNAMGLESGERVAGFLYFGTATEAPCERARPVLDALVSTWSAP